MTMIQVYLDTNIVRDLFEERVTGADQKINLLEEAKDKKLLSIVPSFECLAEIILISCTDEEIYQKVRNGYYKLANWNSVLNDASEVFKENIYSFAESRKTNPFVPIDKNCPFFEAVIREDDVLPTEEIKRTAEKTLITSRDFVQGVLCPNNLNKYKGNYTQNDFEKLFEPGNTAEIIVEDFANRLGVLAECRKRGLMSLLSIPTVRLGVGYILYSWYKQLTTNAKLRTSDACDFRHAVLAGAVGNIITEDRRFRNVINSVPQHKISVWTLDEFIADVL